MSRISPKYLPQITMPIDNVLTKLSEIDCNYDHIQVNPNELKSSQPFVLSDDVYSAVLDDMHPIWVDNNLTIIDGHNKWMKGIDNQFIKCIKINANHKDACRILNKIQDIYEYEQSQGLEEVESQGAINFYQSDENQFLNTLEEDNIALQTETPSKNQKTIIGYRKDPIKENSVVGNFFTLKPVDGYNKYEIDFENLMDTNALGVTYKDGQEPIDILAKSWFPNINFEKLGTEHNTPSVNLKVKAVAEKAMKMGYDGILYNNLIVQGLK